MFLFLSPYFFIIMAQLTKKECEIVQQMIEDSICFGRMLDDYNANNFGSTPLTEEINSISKKLFDTMELDPFAPKGHSKYWHNKFAHMP